MLKVVGASWHKTRIGTYILVGALLLAIGALFLADMERPNYSGTYCATAYWARNSGYRLEFWGQRNDLDLVPRGVVRSCFRDSVLTNGWSQLELESQSSYTDTVQAYAAGMMEGALTWHNIYLHWLNTIDAVCSKDEESQEFCEWLRGLITTNVDTVKKMADMKGKHDHYWYQVALFYDQLDGLEIGFRNGVKRSRLDYDIPTQDFLLMNAAVDIRDLKIYYTSFLMADTGFEPEPAKGMMLLKLLHPQSGGAPRVLLGHTSDGSYSSMLRMVKKYTLRYHFSSFATALNDDERQIVPGTNIVFSGYPGVLASLDDFYVINGRGQHRMVAAGVKMDNDHLALWRKIDLMRSVSLAPRVMAANRLGHSGRTWARYFARNPSTGVKQWLVIDMARFNGGNGTASDPETGSGMVTVDRSDENNEIPSTMDDEPQQEHIVTRLMEDYVDDDFEELRQAREAPKVTVSAQQPVQEAPEPAFGSGMFWVVDQLPGRLHAEDVTEKLVADGYWLTNGVPYFAELLEMGHVKVNVSASLLASIPGGSMEKILNNITDLEALAKFIRQSAYRGDLDHERPAAFGNIDMKLYSEAGDGTNQFRAYSGPLFDRAASWSTGSTTGQAAKRSAINRQQTGADGGGESATTPASHPFDWSSILPFEVRHQGHPDVWDFEHLTPEWAWI
ncbi:putative phospholipase B-like lamina ancestor [Anopheles bellator]|uniref:putative phospholipase B-like lamina ancestor n=1 Tax=Anopheles bellator TaxID=139047 RepID=UPI00264869EA|nr:putative phospholipase B-like lamina ancestor [Anopheles bellator]XP_058054392.1 putative phospholipase B-like lamina ancestor [Anopheles bellator]XP_058054393.1 putative phospholipase B-like lamina ancestor [Anopheles bellator]XP_058054394.1 putative phospholipase B-like lamina ancestor [Anopheles bellator]XP_058054395.1 putative phospholipase B-like lamina ancestor [Anopheles bellator]XP_058054396.1 putative phospholipase B-like lamina ancestor [Anopheles bellator]